MQQELFRFSKVQFIRFRRLQKALQGESHKRNSIQIEIPPLARARLKFEFNPASIYGRREELLLNIESAYFNLPATERGNSPGYPVRDKCSQTIYIPLNTSFKNQKITMSGISKPYHGEALWNDSSAKVLVDKPLEKVIGFNSFAQPDNYNAMQCVITLHLL